MLSMNVKRFGLRTALGAVALGLGLAGAAAVSTPAQADEWHHGWHGGYGGWGITAVTMAITARA